MGYFMGPGDGPSIYRVHISNGIGATVRQNRHVVTPLVCLEMHAVLMHCAADNAEVLTEQQETKHLEGDQARLSRYERGVLEVNDTDMNEVPPYQNDEFMQQVQRMAVFDHVRAAPPAPPALVSCTPASAHSRITRIRRLAVLQRPHCPVDGAFLMQTTLNPCSLPLRVGHVWAPQPCGALAVFLLPSVLQWRPGFEGSRALALWRSQLRSLRQKSRLLRSQGQYPRKMSMNPI